MSVLLARGLGGPPSHTPLPPSPACPPNPHVGGSGICPSSLGLPFFRQFTMFAHAQVKGLHAFEEKTCFKKERGVAEHHVLFGGGLSSGIETRVPSTYINEDCPIFSLNSQLDCPLFFLNSQPDCPLFPLNSQPDCPLFALNSQPACPLFVLN